jgi:hypothetical protein
MASPREVIDLIERSHAEPIAGLGIRVCVISVSLREVETTPTRQASRVGPAQTNEGGC